MTAIVESIPITADPRLDSRRAVPAHDKPAGASFADTFARYAIPLFSPWPPALPPRDEMPRNPEPAIAVRPGDQRHERRQRSRE